MKLFPFQEEAVEKSLVFLNGPRRAVYNASEMGLGKSIQALTCAKRLGVKSILIICPAGATFVWRDEIAKWFSDAERHIDILITSYGKLLNEKNLQSVVRRRWDLLILDESHFLKSPSAKRTKIVLKNIWPQCDRHICLSGTPLTQSVADGWTLFSKIMPEFGSYWEFCHRYTKVQVTPWGQKPTGIKNAEELKGRIRDNFFIRYLKEDVCKELPAKTWVKITLDKKFAVKLTQEDEAKQRAYLIALKQAFTEGKSVAAAPPKALATWRMEQGIKKVPEVVTFCKDILDQETPLVLFTYHKEVLKQLKEALNSYNPCVIEGSTLQKDRATAAHDFQAGKSNLFIGQINAAGTAITLIRSSIVVFAELDWSPPAIKQASDRCHRIGTKYPVTLYFFCVEDSIDEDLTQTLVSKQKVFDEALG